MGGGDRGARPTQTPFLASADSESYLDGEPSQDERFVPMFAHALEQTGGYTPERAIIAARSLLPDVIPFSPRLAAAYPANGRTPRDDSKDVFLTVMNGRLTWDKTGPHTDLLDEFPFWVHRIHRKCLRQRERSLKRWLRRCRKTVLPRCGATFFYFLTNQVAALFPLIISFAVTAGLRYLSRSLSFFRTGLPLSGTTVCRPCIVRSCVAKPGGDSPV